ncbi:MAG: transcription termination factor Rho [Aquihabitans sp.]
MSEGQPFDPSMLDRKDRAELVAIATSLGEKVPARAKKADIAALILKAVGADSVADSSVEPEAAAEKAAPSKAPAAGGERGPQSGKGDDNIDKADGGQNGSRGSGPRGQDKGGQDKGGQDRGGQDKGRQQGGDDRPSGRQNEPKQGGGNQGGGKQTDDKQGQSSQSGGDADPGNRADPQHQSDEGDGNRRRRRRGRDRNRPQDEDQGPAAEPVAVEGFVDLRDEGYGFLRVNGYTPSPEDAYISVKQVRQFSLRKGDVVGGKSRAANRNEKNPALVYVDTVNGVDASEAPQVRPEFDSLTPLFPDSLLRLEQTEFPENMTARLIDLLAPIGKGQRGLIVSPPKAGKTTVLKQIVRAVERNHPDVHVIVLLIDERPEEVTDMKRWILNGEVAASTFDRPTEEHVALAELVIERAKRMVETGRDVMVVLDGITRLARAYNLAAPSSGRTMAGGMDSGALYPPKQFFGAARNVEEGGSLTILATALVETNTRLDEVIFEEFEGAGNMELRLDRRLADRRVYPAIDVDSSSTRHEEMLYDRRQLQQVYQMRRLLADLKAENGSGAAGLELLVERLKVARTNEAFLDEIARSTKAGE